MIIYWFLRKNRKLHYQLWPRLIFLRLPLIIRQQQYNQQFIFLNLQRFLLKQRFRFQMKLQRFLISLINFLSQQIKIILQLIKHLIRLKMLQLNYRKYQSILLILILLIYVLLHLIKNRFIQLLFYYLMILSINLMLCIIHQNQLQLYFLIKSCLKGHFLNEKILIYLQLLIQVLIQVNMMFEYTYYLKQ